MSAKDSKFGAERVFIAGFSTGFRYAKSLLLSTLMEVNHEADSAAVKFCLDSYEALGGSRLARDMSIDAVAEVEDDEEKPTIRWTIEDPVTESTRDMLLALACYSSFTRLSRDNVLGNNYLDEVDFDEACKTALDGVYSIDGFGIRAPGMSPTRYELADSYNSWNFRELYIGLSYSVCGSSVEELARSLDVPVKEVRDVIKNAGLQKLKFSPLASREVRLLALACFNTLGVSEPDDDIDGPAEWVLESVDWNKAALSALEGRFTLDGDDLDVQAIVASDAQMKYAFKKYRRDWRKLFACIAQEEEVLYVSAVADKLGVRPNWVYSVLRKFGIPPYGPSTPKSNSADLGFEEDLLPTKLSSGQVRLLAMCVHNELESRNKEDDDIVNPSVAVLHGALERAARGRVIVGGVEVLTKKFRADETRAKYAYQKYPIVDDLSVSIDASFGQFESVEELASAYDFTVRKVRGILERNKVVFVPKTK